MLSVGQRARKFEQRCGDEHQDDYEQRRRKIKAALTRLCQRTKNAHTLVTLGGLMRIARRRSQTLASLAAAAGLRGLASVPHVEFAAAQRPRRCDNCAIPGTRAYPDARKPPLY